MIVVTAAGPALTGLVGGVLPPGSNGLSADEVEMIALMVGAVVSVAGVIAWVDRRIDKKIKASDEIDLVRHQQIRGELRHLAQLISIQLKIPIALAEDDERRG